MRVVGARPQFMQEVVFRREVERRGHREILIHTGQHYDEKMSRIFFDELGIPPPDVNLEVGSCSHGKQTGSMLKKLDEILEKHKPDMVVVDGDTNSTLAGALSAAKFNIPVAHVEAGLRSYDRHMPEEINRVLVDHLGSLLCAPTKTAIRNLEKEGLVDNAVLTGDLMYDCFLHFQKSADNIILQELQVKPGMYLLATVHRAENTDDQHRFKEIISGLCRLPLPVLLPVHPRIREELSHLLQSLPDTKKIRAIEPVSYLQMLALEQNAQCILTDSGGVQREAYFAGKPSVVLRENTEWVEQVDSGWSYLAKNDADDILAGYEKLTSGHLIEQPEVYGNGNAAGKVISAIERVLA